MARSSSKHEQKSNDAARPPLDAAALNNTTFDVVIAADLTVAGERAFRIAQEARSFARDGKRVALVHVGYKRSGERIAAEVHTCVRSQIASAISNRDVVSTRLLLIHAPSEIDWLDRPLTDVTAENAVVICHTASDYQFKGVALRQSHSADVTYFAVNSWVRALAPYDRNVSDTIWHPMLLDYPSAPPKPLSHNGTLRVGWIETPDLETPSSSNLAEVIPLSQARLERLSLDRLGLLDCLAYFPQPGTLTLLDTTIRAALKMGVRVALPAWLRAHFGDGPVYCKPDRALKRLVQSKERPTSASPPAVVKPADRRPVMFVPSNGVGVGHVSRLLAIARRMEKTTPILFVTQAQAVSLIEGLGFRAEYTPSAGYVGGRFERWDEWYKYGLEKLIDAYDPALVVYDGNNPSDGLIDAVASRRDCKLAWVRRGMWGTLSSPFMRNASWFNLIIEPGELDGMPDLGITARRRNEALVVPPIRFLDEGDVVPRTEAAKHLGLDPDRPSVLIQLGAGYNRDVIGLIDRIIAVLRATPKLQVCVAEWSNSAQPLGFWPEVVYLRGFPLSQYFRAFDFSIAAAGYNTFHEVVSFDLPTIFIPNRHPAVDDQAARAVHLQSNHAGFELDETDLADLPDLVSLLLDAKARDFLVGNSRSLHLPNGAMSAARALTSLLELS